MKANYDPEEDILYIVVKEGRVFDSKEVDEDIRLEYDGKGEVAGVEIMNARRNIARAFQRDRQGNSSSGTLAAYQSSQEDGHFNLEGLPNPPQLRKITRSTRRKDISKCVRDRGQR